jgi:ABC-type uncharacterized transport system substrate-binding protein
MSHQTKRPFDSVECSTPHDLLIRCLTFDPGTLLSRSTRFDAFFQGLRDLGYIDGQTITIDYLSADGHGERFPMLAAECLRLKADIIAVSTTPAAQVAKEATHTVPIVMIALGDPVGTGGRENVFGWAARAGVRKSIQ